MAAERDIVRMHACAFNGRDLETLARQAQPDAPCFCDGEWVGEGPGAMREALEREFRLEVGLIGRVAHLDDEPVVMEVAGSEGRWEPRGLLRFRGDGAGRIRELRIEHGEASLAGLVPGPGR